MQLRECGQKARKEVHERDADAAVEKAVATGSGAQGSEPPHQWRASHAGCSRLQLHQQRQRSSRPPGDRTWGSAFMQVPMVWPRANLRLVGRRVLHKSHRSCRLGIRAKFRSLTVPKGWGPRGMLRLAGRGKCTRIIEDVLQSCSRSASEDASAFMQKFQSVKQSQEWQADWEKSAQESSKLSSRATPGSSRARLGIHAKFQSVMEGTTKEKCTSMRAGGLRHSGGRPEGRVWAQALTAPPRQAAQAGRSSATSHQEHTRREPPLPSSFVCVCVCVCVCVLGPVSVTVQKPPHGGGKSGLEEGGGAQLQLEARGSEPDVQDGLGCWMTQEKRLEAVLQPRMRSRQGGSWLNQGEESRSRGVDWCDQLSEAGGGEQLACQRQLPPDVVQHVWEKRALVQQNNKVRGMDLGPHSFMTKNTATSGCQRRLFAGDQKLSEAELSLCQAPHTDKAECSSWSGGLEMWA